MGPSPWGTRVSADLIFCNTRIKQYPDGSAQVLVCDKPIFGGAGWERQGRELRPKVAGSHRAEGETCSGDRAMRRARGQVRDLALCTPFRYFVTLTLDAAKVDRYGMAAITRKLNTWADNQVRRKGLAYVLVPERHKDGAVHFHGFFNDALQAVDSGTMTLSGWKAPRKPRTARQRAEWAAMGAQVVYNLPGWSLGFTTAIPLYGDYHKAVSYVCKYIGKDGEKIGGRWYYSGGALGRPEVTYCDSDLREMEQAPGAYRFDIEDAGLSFVQVNYEPAAGGQEGGAAHGGNERDSA